MKEGQLMAVFIRGEEQEAFGNYVSVSALNVSVHVCLSARVE